MHAPPDSFPIRIGCAGWNIPREHAARFSTAGSHLHRYGRTLSAVEINSSFYRPHRPTTYARWAESVPENFRFSVKVPKEITHHRRLTDTAELFAQFLHEVNGLGDRLGCLLVQLPPSLKLNVEVAGKCFRDLRVDFDGPVVCEPRHASWFSEPAAELFQEYHIGRVAADPAPHAAANRPAGNSPVKYFRLHGSPTMYYSPYTSEYLSDLAATLVTYREQGFDVWCIFDNTAAGYATVNALQLQELLEEATS